MPWLGRGTRQPRPQRRARLFADVRAAILKIQNPDAGRGGVGGVEIDTAIGQLVNEAVAAYEIVDIYKLAGIETPELSILLDDFLDSLAHKDKPNLQMGLLRRLLNDQIRSVQRANLVQARKFSEQLEEAINKYTNRSLTTAEIIAELVKLAKEMRDQNKRHEELGLSVSEAAFYDAERALFPREISVDPGDQSESLRVQLVIAADPDDDQAITVRRWFPEAGHDRTPTREQLAAFGWRYLPATRGTSASSLDGPNSALQALLAAIDLGAEKTVLTSLLDNFNSELGSSTTITGLRGDVAAHLSKAMPRTIAQDDFSVRTRSRSRRWRTWQRLDVLRARR